MHFISYPQLAYLRQHRQALNLGGNVLHLTHWLQNFEKGV